MSEREIPVCPECHKPHTLMLTGITTVVCSRDKGGCGVQMRIDELPRMYAPDRRGAA